MFYVAKVMLFSDIRNFLNGKLKIENGECDFWMNKFARNRDFREFV